MVKRNDPCPCGSGKKYKKCCEGKQQVTVETVQIEELERVLQTFYLEYPERKDVRAYIEHVATWQPKLESVLQRELIEAIALDDFFFHQEPSIWKSYLKKTKKKAVRPSTVKVLEDWSQPTLFIGTVSVVEEKYFKASHLLTNEELYIRRENDKPIPEGMHVFAFILPDGTKTSTHYLAVSTLIFFPEDHLKVFEEFKKNFEASEKKVGAFLKEEHLTFWELLVSNGYKGEEFTNFESTVLTQVKDFLEQNDRETAPMLELLEDYLIEGQPTARKEAAIAAGAIRYGQEKELFESLSMTVKEIAATFDISASSLTKYYQDLSSYVETK
ncbi:SEC-C domain-containing protein [Lysinibacillus sp. ZYM-1]|uniref:SEC-C domain-containing protein n=1 Tax=Lysinibacillus sp. ZYM-1 TaxID=1681184 RepID=UPI0006CE8B50|nr:SEC-C metal-binding domain-containing protein [Lysinibacillus sp. ZYM-1]KPN97992.1 metal-binding protein [Lysinibacillus sp. ZYM-1]